MKISFLLFTLLLLASCAGGMSPEILALLEVEEGEQKIVCFRSNVQSPVPGSSSSAEIGVLALPQNSETLTAADRIAAMNACF